MNRIFPSIEKSFHLSMLALIMGALIPLWQDMSGNPVDPYEGDGLTRGLLLAGYSLVLFLLLRTPKRSLRAFLQSPALGLLLLWTGFSLAWTTTPEVTLRKVAAVFLTSLYGVYLALRFTPWKFLRLLGYTLLALLGASLLLIFLLPEWGVMGYPHEGAWRGIFVHKNMLGRFASFGILVFLALLVSGEREERPLWLGGLFLSSILLLGSRSATSWILAVVVFMLALGLRLATSYRGLWPLFLFALPVAGGSAMALASSYETILESLGRDVTLTGRVPLWLTLIPFIQERPWTGYGLGGFWLGWKGPSAYVWSQVGWNPPHGHNGYLDLWLDLGLVGFLLGLWILLSLLLQGVRQYLREGFSGMTLFLAGLGVFLAVYNLTESNFLRANNFYWLLLTWGYVSPKVAAMRKIKEKKKEGTEACLTSSLLSERLVS